MLHVLAVDDEIDFSKTIARFLEKKGYRVSMCKTGEKALKMIDEERPDIVLLDLNMPGMGGELTLNEIKMRYQDLPVLIVTAISDREKAVKLLMEGASDYISKPIDFAYLEKYLSTWESLSRIRAVAKSD